MEKNSTSKRILGVSIFILLFFLGLQFVAYFKIESIPVGIIVELITIPLLITVPILLIIAIKNWKKEKWNLKSRNALSFGLLILTILLLVFVSF